MWRRTVMSEYSLEVVLFIIILFCIIWFILNVYRISQTRKGPQWPAEADGSTVRMMKEKENYNQTWKYQSVDDVKTVYQMMFFSRLKHSMQYSLQFYITIMNRWYRTCKELLEFWAVIFTSIITTCGMSLFSSLQEISISPDVLQLHILSTKPFSWTSNILCRLLQVHWRWIVSGGSKKW